MLALRTLKARKPKRVNGCMVPASLAQQNIAKRMLARERREAPASSNGKYLGVILTIQQRDLNLSLNCGSKLAARCVGFNALNHASEALRIPAPGALHVARLATYKPVKEVRRLIFPS